MEGRQFDDFAKSLATWRTRRQVVAGTAVAAVAGLLARIGARSQTGGDAVATFPVEAEQVDQTTETTTETERPPTETPTDTPTPTPTDTPTPTPTDTPGPAEPDTNTQTTGGGEQPGEDPPVVVDEQRVRIAEVCRAASDALEEELGLATEYLRHPHAEQALAFVAQLRTLAEWGAANAESWTDSELNNYLAAVSTAALGVRVGADAYYELNGTSNWSQSARQPEDPDTCIFQELAKWEECLANRDNDNIAGQFTCFWEFTVLKSCTRCLRAF